MKQKQHTIAGNIVNLSIPEQVQQQNDFLSLNDDCILEICKYLNLNDLSNIANVCSRLNALAKEDFSSRYNSKLVAVKDVEENVEKCIRTFGSQIQSLRLDRLSYHSICKEDIVTNIFRQFSKCCRSLTSLEMRGFDCRPVSDSIAEDLIPLSSRLHKLALTSCCVSEKLLAILDPNEISLSYVDINEDDTNTRHLSRLKTMNFEDIENWDRRLLKLIKHAKTIENLESL